jgi:hypothetical protein
MNAMSASFLTDKYYEIDRYISSFKCDDACRSGSWYNASSFRAYRWIVPRSDPGWHIRSAIFSRRSTTSSQRPFRSSVFAPFADVCSTCSLCSFD